ncbi:peptide/nickel transport system permease protein [Saccharothrix tamanrassetensis]|uniref:Oligopeptide transport system permease protein OppC n=1 Tax=Saccharothrix tamanrassetensis TaxID=1051531 RepID=A0A841CM26_9PSEU|nr:peptide/nickel transport system permease protein [Saccharothrix tamanrassetensis]
MAETVQTPLAPDVDGEAPVATPRWRLVVRRFLRHRLATISLVVFVLLVLLAFVGGELWHYRYDVYTPDNSQPPSAEHPFGTDATGYDLLAQVLRGTQRSIEIALFVAAVSGVFGSVWGAVAGFHGGKVDTLMMRVADLVLIFPAIAVAAVLANNVGASSQGWLLIGLVLAALTWPYVARLVRGVVLSLREREFIAAARTFGAGSWRIIFRHVLPNAMGTVIVAVTIIVAVAILAETALSFIGFGVRPPDTSLGLLVSQNQTAVSTRPWLFYFPGLFIVVIALSINFIGDGLRDAFDNTRSRSRR